jgi:hypothetical protein
LVNLANLAAPFLIVGAFVLTMGGTSSADLQLHRDGSPCPPPLQLHWSLRIAWDQPKSLPPPELILRHRFASHHLLIACSSARCLMSISEDDQKPTRQEPI